MRFLGKATGDLYIKGICGIIFSEIYVEDLLLYRSNVSASDTFNIELPSHFEITAKVTKTTSSSAYCHYDLFNDNTEIYDAGSLRQNGSITIRHNPTNNLIADQNTSVIPLNTEKTLTYVYNNGQHSLSCNGTTITATDSNTFNKFKKVTIQNYTVTDLKIKKL